MAKMKSASSGGKVGALAVLAVVALGSFVFFSGACRDSERAGKDARKTYEKGKDIVKEGLDKGAEVAKEGLEKSKEVAKEGVDRTREAAQDFGKGWKEGGK